VSRAPSLKNIHHKKPGIRIQGAMRRMLRQIPDQALGGLGAFIFDRRGGC